MTILVIPQIFGQLHALTAVVEKLLHKILSCHFEAYLRYDVLNPSVWNGVVSGLPGVFEYIIMLYPL